VTSPSNHNKINLQVLRAIESNLGLAHPQLAQVLGVSLGKAHYSINALMDKGQVKAGNFSHNHKMLDYADHLNPSGMKRKAMLTAHFLERKAAEYTMLKSELEKNEITSRRYSRAIKWA
jgi:EPS-associated MarR family transcriptional regulator